MITLSRAAGAAACLALGVANLPASAAYVRPGPTVLVVHSSLTGKVPTTGSSGFERVSADGRYVAYASNSTDIVAGDTNLVSDVFEWDRVTGKTVRVSVASGGAQGIPAKVDANHPLPQGSLMGDVSADGRYVVFSSDDTNLVIGDTNVAADVFVHDRVTGSTRRASVSSSGAQADNGALDAVTISANGRYVAFLSTATNLVAGDTNGVADAFVHDMVTRRTTRVSDDATGAGSEVAISSTGRYVAYSTYDPGNRPAQVWVRDLNTGSERRADIPAPGIAPPAQTPVLGGAFASQDGISSDGRYVLFESADPYVPTKTTRAFVSNTPAVEFYRHDFVTGRTERVSLTSAGEERDGGLLTTAQMSPDGRFVAFDTRGALTASQAAPCADAFGLSCPNRHVFVRDMQQGSTEMEVWTYDGRTGADGFAEGAQWASISANARYVSFATNSESMYPGQPARGQPGDAWWTYLRDRGVPAGVDSLTVDGSTSGAFTRTDADADADAGDDIGPSLAALGADISGASVVQRPSDLYVRIELSQMPAYDVALPGLVYACDVTVDGVRYEVRVGKVGSAPSFTLFRSAGRGWQRIATLRGGYGTAGAEVDAAVPLRLIGWQRGARIGDISARTGFGAPDTGIDVAIDRL